MPVWHERTRERVATGDLVVVAIATEQHRERTALWAEHQGIDWPIAWDPFNLTGSFAVPNAILVDARGVVVRAGVRVDELDGLLDRLTPPEAEAEDTEAADTTTDAPPRRLAQLDRLDDDDPQRPALEALSRCLWSNDGPNAADLELLAARATGEDRRADHVFQYGVARMLAYDANGARGPDFARAVAAWHDAFALTPRKYVWRRRIQQYGPRLDQPYDFYAWLPDAYRALSMRTGWSFDGPLHLTPTELALAPSDDRVVVPPGAELVTAWPDADTRLDVVAVRGTGDGADRVCVHATIAARTHEPRRVRLAPTDLERVTIGTRVATLGRRFAFGTDALRYTVDLPLEEWESDAPLPAHFVFERHATDEASRRVEAWVDLRAFAE